MRLTLSNLPDLVEDVVDVARALRIQRGEQAQDLVRRGLHDHLIDGGVGGGDGFRAVLDGRLLGVLPQVGQRLGDVCVREPDNCKKKLEWLKHQF